METVRFHNLNMFFSSGQNSSHLVGSCEQFGAHEKLCLVQGLR